MINLSLLQDFIIEAVEHLEEMESCLLQLETDPDNRDILNDIFRSIHTIKGAAQFVGIERISNLSHTLENLLDLLRTGEKQLNQEIVDTLIEAKDRITFLVNELESSQSEETEIDDILARIKILLADSGEADETNADTKAPEQRESIGGGDQEIPGESLADESYTEEFDEELSDIFIKQLSENISFLKAETEKLSTVQNKAAALNRCADSIKSLQSAANYMGYEKLTRHYKNWCLKIDRAKEELSAGKKLSFDFMNANIDEVVRVFPRITEALVEGGSDHGIEDDMELKTDLEDAFTSIDELEAMSDDLFGEDGTGDGPKDIPGGKPGGKPGAKIDLPPNAPAQKTVNNSLEDESYTEEFDEELSGIFIKQLSENLSFLQAETNKLSTAQNKDEILIRCADSIKSLQSAANYMGYEKLTRHYKNWCLKIDQAKDELSEKEDVSFGFMNANIDDIVRVFPRIKETLSEKISDQGIENDMELEADLEDAFTSIDELEAMSESSDRIGEDSSGDAMGDTPNEKFDLPPLIDEDTEDATEMSDPEPDDNDLFDMLSESFDESMDAVGDAAGDTATATDQAPDNKMDENSDEEMADQALFDKLSNAFDSSMEPPTDTKPEPMHDVLEEMLFSDEEAEESSLPLPEPEIPPEPDKEKYSTETEPTDQDLMVSDFQSDVPEKKEIPVESPVLAQAEEKEDLLADVDDRRESERRIIKRRKSDESGKKVFRQSVRVDADKIDSLMNQVGELVVSRAFFVQLLNDMKNLQQDMKKNTGITQKELKPVRDLAFRLSEATVALGRVSNELQEGVMKVRMLPISQLFNRYPRLVRDLVHKTDKQVKLEVRGEDTELDKMVIEEISDPLIHLIRNSVDHGIESVEERRRMGKPETGTLILEAYHESNHIVIEIIDDGKGIDPDRIKAKALEKGLFTKEELGRMSAAELTRIIMTPGFSTAQKATQTSGRGVGMDVVKKNVEKLNGTIEIESQPGISTRMRFKIPLTLAIIPALMVRVGGELFTIPLSTVEETLRIHEHETSTIEGVEVIHLRNTTMPIFRLSDIFSIPSDTHENEVQSFVVIVSTGMQQIGLVVDQLMGQEEVVIKPLEDYLREKSGFSGATIIGDGRISLILDIYELIKMTSNTQIKRQKNQAYKRKSAANKKVLTEA